MIAGILRSLFMSIGVAFLFQAFFVQIQSTTVFEFLKANITNIQVALLALNTATLSIVLTKIKELIDKTDKRDAFETTRKEMMLSINEQVALIVASLMIIALSAAKAPLIEVSDLFYPTLLLAAFIYSLLILYDTAKSVFIVLDY